MSLKVRRFETIRLLGLLVVVLISFNAASAKTSVVSFNTSDGWKITGNLTLPDNAGTGSIPAVVMLTEPGWVDRSIYATYLSDDLAKTGIAALAIDLRGSGNSLGKKVLEEFSSEEMKGIQQDVRAAIAFLSTRPGIDPNRIGVVGAGISSEYAVQEAAVNPQIQALVLISGKLSPETKEYFAQADSVPVLTVVGKEDRKSFREMAQVFAASKNRSSDMIPAVGHGAVMFSHTEGLEERVVGWVVANLKNLGSETEVSFQSEDGWKLHGLLRLPEGASANAKVPVVVLVHGAKHDQQTYHFMAREIAKRGMASLRFDWRGKGNSSHATAAPDQDKVYLDVKAAIQFLATQSAIDSSKMGAVAATAACVNTLQAGLGDPRVKTFVLLTALEPNPEVVRLFGSSNTPILSIASTEDNNYQRGSLAESTRQIYKLSKSKQSEFLLYDDAGRGSEMLKVKPELEPMILRWLSDKLQGISPTEISKAL
jgi:dienelactone hydrolase